MQSISWLTIAICLLVSYVLIEIKTVLLIRRLTELEKDFLEQVKKSTVEIIKRVH